VRDSKVNPMGSGVGYAGQLKNYQFPKSALAIKEAFNSLEGGEPKLRLH
jgi:hypothetical protein